MSGDVARLIEIMAALRTPGSGCSWDLEQTFSSIAPYDVEEAYEVVDAIERGDLDDLRDELGDLLLQVVFHARMAQEQGAFAFPDVVEAICDKLMRRHPHVFRDGAPLTPATSPRIGARSRRRRRRAKSRKNPGRSRRKPARRRATRPARPDPRGQAAGEGATVGFDWNDARHVLGKIREETDEVAAELAAAPF